MALAFIPPADIINAFIELVDDDDLPQELVEYFETHYIVCVCVGGGGGNLVVVEFLLLFLDQLANTSNGVEGFHNALQASVTNAHPNLWKLINVLKNEEYIFLKRR